MFTRFAWLAGFSIALITVEKHSPNTLASVRSSLSTVLYPLQVIAGFPVDSYYNIKNIWVASQKNDKKNGGLSELKTLRTQLLTLQVQLQRLVALESENQRLRELLSSSSKVPQKTLMADIVSVDLDPFSHKILINKGHTHQVKTGQAVLDAHGILGQIVHVSQFSSTAIMLTDPNHAIPVQVNRNGLRTLVHGTGSASKLQVNYVPSNADIKQGDLLVTSGLGNRFPAGYPVGIIKNIHIDPSNPYLSITAEPSAQTESSREVVIVQNEAAFSPLNSMAEYEEYSLNEDKNK